MDTWPQFFCYDVRGIQKYIFKVPRLKYIIGGSALLDFFDRQTVPSLSAKAEHIYSAGGRGAFRCNSENDARELEDLLIASASRIGLDLRVACSPDFSDAAHTADHLFPFIPESLEGPPCGVSGAYPVPPRTAKTDDAVHPVVWRRVFDRGNRMRTYFEDRLLPDLTLPVELEGMHCEFFSDVSSGSDNHTLEAEAGAASLGNRNRWAIISMDGNDMGMQFAEFAEQDTGGDTLAEWISLMSDALNRCSEEAAKAGIAAVLNRWAADGIPEGAYAGENELILPVRPLVVGGDDIVVITHASYAFDFVRAATDAFSFFSRNHGKEWTKGAFWPATNNQLSISAGILVAPVTYPLHTAVPYSESLLASAKHKGRGLSQSGEPAPPCLDWEQVTESLLDTPAARRQREMRFWDEDINQIVELTRRPYTLEEFKDIETLAKQLGSVPASIRHQMLPSLRTGSADRRVFLARLEKHQPELARMLDEGEAPDNVPPNSRWLLTGGREEKRTRSTDVVDALLLLEEQARMEWETAI